MNPPDTRRVSPVQQMVSSGAGALLVSLFMTPLDVVKIRLQAQERLFSKKCFLYSNGIMDHLLPRLNGDPPQIALHSHEEICNCRWYNRPKYFNGTIDAFVKISRLEGISSLWSGLSPTLVLALPATVIYFTTYEQLKTFGSVTLGGNDSQLSLACGALARTWAVTVVSPLELIRTKMQSQKMAFFDVKEAVASTVRTQGLRGLWKGYTATLLRDVPFSALYWPFYEALKPEDGNFRDTFVAGSVSGSVASALTLPMDVIKTRLQMELGEKIVDNANSSAKTRSNWAVAKEIFKLEGLTGFYVGLVPRILKVAPACAIMISTYEYCKGRFVQYNRALEYSPP